MDNKEKKIAVPVSGMHCRSCEILIEDKLSELAGVKKAAADFNKGVVEVSYEHKTVEEEQIIKAICDSGYCIGKGGGAKGFLSRDKKTYTDLGIGILVLAGLYLILRASGLTDLNFNLASAELTLPLVLVIGLTAGISTCMALVGGLVLGASAKYSKSHPEAGGLKKFRPHLLFNLGRVLGYALLGGILGLVGSAFQMSSLFLGIVTLIVGLVMLLMGGQLIGVFPWLDNFRLTLPKGVSRAMGIKNDAKDYNDWQTAILGAITFFLPCGFTQAMQIYAVSTGTFSRGALIMGAFALGTAPGILSIGGLASFVKGKLARRFFKAAGLAIILFAFFNISNAFGLFGFELPGKTQNVAQAVDPNVTLENGVQVVRMKELRSGYSPNHFTIVKDLPVKWIVDAQDPYSCASVLLMKKYNVRKFLAVGENIINFTPTEIGTIKFSCSMGMYSGSFTVIEKGEVKSSQSPLVPSVAQAKESAQEISSTFNVQDDIQPNLFHVKAGKALRYTINVEEDALGCMSEIKIPDLYEESEPLKASRKIVMEFTPSEKGQYPITCGMGMQRGLIIVE